MSMPYFIYKITNNINGKIYIGKTNDIQKRWYNHVYCALVRKLKTHLYNAIRKFGAENFDIEILGEYESEELALCNEINWIKILCANDNKIGYNLTIGGEGVSGLVKSESSKQKQRDKMLGRKLSDDHKTKISNGNKGKLLSQENKDKISLANSGQNNGMFGRTSSKETKQKLSDFQSKRQRNPLTEEHKKNNREKAQQQDHSFRIPIEIKNEIITLYASENYTKKQLAEKFDLKYNSIVKIIRSHKI